MVFIWDLLHKVCTRKVWTVCVYKRHQSGHASCQHHLLRASAYLMQTLNHLGYANYTVTRESTMHCYRLFALDYQHVRRWMRDVTLTINGQGFGHYRWSRVQCTFPPLCSWSMAPMANIYFFNARSLKSLFVQFPLKINWTFMCHYLNCLKNIVHCLL